MMFSRLLTFGLLISSSIWFCSHIKLSDTQFYNYVIGNILLCSGIIVGTLCDIYDEFKKAR